MTLEQELDEFAQRGGGRKTIGPREGQDLEAFQVTISSLEGYQRARRLRIVSKHEEQRTGRRNIDSVTIELTPEDWHRTDE